MTACTSMLGVLLQLNLVSLAVARPPAKQTRHDRELVGHQGAAVNSHILTNIQTYSILPTSWKTLQTSSFMVAYLQYLCILTICLVTQKLKSICTKPLCCLKKIILNMLHWFSAQDIGLGSYNPCKTAAKSNCPQQRLLSPAKQAASKRSTMCKADIKLPSLNVFTEQENSVVVCGCQALHTVPLSRSNPAFSVRPSFFRQNSVATASCQDSRTVA